MKKSQERQEHAPRARKNGKTRQKPQKLLNVTEDAELGYRLARMRLRTGVIAPPTYEEAPVSIEAWGKQRSRWIKGHMQTWLTLMRDPVRSAREMGLGPFLAAHLVLGGGVAASFAHGWLALLLLFAAVTPFDLLSHADITLALSGYSIAMFSAFSAVALTGDTAHFRAALGMPFYWPLHSIAALMALGDLLIRPHHWAKTEHGVSERHRVIAVQTPAYRSAASKPQAVSMSRSA